MVLSKNQAKEKIRKLIEKFKKNESKYRKDSETDIRIKLIDPLLEALGWDVNGDDIPDEVLREEGIKTKGGTKKADYTLRINGVTKLTVEAKAVYEDLEKEEFKKQAINYAYNKACNWAVLTDFEGVKIFFVSENSMFPYGDVNLSNLDDFERNFEELWLISKENVVSGALDDIIKRKGWKKKTSIDQKLYTDLKRWREILSNDIKKQHKEYDEDTIDEIVQKIIDRLIFIRKTEDAGTEDRKLEQLTRRFGTKTYNQLKDIFVYYNKKYNSKLFGETEKDKHPTDVIEITNKVIEEVIKSLYRPSGTNLIYDFDAIDADVLGNIYEQYLTYILTKVGKKTKLDGGKAHKKEQGIYYTPTYIVDYIVRNTIGDVIKTKKPDEITKIKILDPACGSGSFLIKSFDFLNEYYNKKEGKEKQTTLDRANEDLFTRKSKILKDNIFGVDLDTKAIEIAQLNLLLKLTEEKKRLPTLRNNIRTGNSLIDDPQFSKRPFNWKNKFEDVMNNGGFDIIIGNPPYGADLSLEEKTYLNKKYNIGSTDTAILFIKNSFGLLKEGGRLGFIVPKALCFASNYKKIREFIWDHVETIVDCGKVWKEVKLEQVIFILKKGDKLNTYNSGKLNGDIIEIIGKINKDDAKGFGFFLNGISSEEVELAKKIKRNSIMLNDISTNQRGAILQKFVSDKGDLDVIGGAQVQRFGIVGIKGKIDKSKINFDQAYIKDNSVLVQRIVAHITKPVDHIQITACIPENKNYIIVDTINQITVKNNSPYFIWYLLNSQIVNWYAYRFVFGKAIRTMQFDNPTTSRLPIPKITKNQEEKVISYVKQIIEDGKKLQKVTKNTNEWNHIKENIENIEEKINKEIYKLYGITEKEKKIIEESFVC